MKNTISKKRSIDPIAEAKKGAFFEQFSKEAQDRIRFGVEVYNVRESLGLSQQELAKRAKTTQRIISQIESADINLGFALLIRLTNALRFNYENWGRVLNFAVPYKFLFVGSTTNNGAIKVKGNTLSSQEYNLLIKK